MFCGKCGKEMADNAKFCPHCGERNTNAAQAGVIGTRAQPMSISVKNKNLFEIIMMVCGILHILMFFMLSYGKTIGLTEDMRVAVSYLGISLPQKLTGLNAIRIMEDLSQLGIENARTAYAGVVVIFGLPLVLGAVIILVNILQKRKLVLPVILSVLTLCSYFVGKRMLAEYLDLGYKLGGGFWIVCLVSLLQLAAAGMNYAANKKP